MVVWSVRGGHYRSEHRKSVKDLLVSIGLCAFVSGADSSNSGKVVFTSNENIIEGDTYSAIIRQQPIANNDTRRAVTE